MKPNKPSGNGSNNKRNVMGIVSIILWALVVTILINYFTSMASSANSTEIYYSEFIRMVEEDKVYSVTMTSGKFTIYLKEDAAKVGIDPDAVPAPTPAPEGDSQLFDITGQNADSEPLDTRLSKARSYYCAPLTSASLRDEELTQLLKEHNVRFGTPYEPELSPVVAFLVSYLLPMLIMVVLFSFLFRSMAGKMGGGGLGGVGKSNAKVYVEKKTGVTFRDVAGQDEAKESLEEIIDFLHNPQKYTEIGAKLPKGALLVGPPGTGKTLLAKAVAGEANVPFFSISGSDFVEMFVGVGASRVRDLFKEANKMAPCIVFIDEIDTIGKSRDNRMGGNDEREQTLNQLLAEMDGFDGRKGVVLLAATNRPESLDPALLRPGRFDRRVRVELPDLQGRIAILKVHGRDVHLDADVDWDAIARATAGASGAELANIVNEGALRAVRMGRRTVTQADLEESVETVIAGAQRKNAVISPEEKKIVAYHEIGHALVAALQTHSAPVTKITIIPRTSGALGYTMQVEQGEKTLMSRTELTNKIATLTGGRAAEELVFGPDNMTTGASNDIEQATKLSRAMVTRYGMTDEFDMVALETVQNQYLGGDTSLACAADTASRVDTLVVETVKNAHDKARRLLREHEDQLHKLAAYLLEKETITGEEFMALLNEK